MSDRRRRRRTTPTPVETTAKQRGRSIARGDMAAIVAAVILAGIPFALGRYMEFNSPGPFDSGAYVYSAQHLLSGARLGVDEIPSARPGTLLVNVVGVALFGYGEFGPKLIQGLLQAAALVLMFVAMRRLFGRVAAVLAPALAAFYLSAPVMAKFGNVKEQYMIALMVIAGSAFLLMQRNHRWFWAMLSGAAAVSVPYFKATGISVLFAMAMYEVALVLGRRRPGRVLATDAFFFASGSALGILPLLAMMIWQGRVDAMLHPMARTFFSVVLLLAALGAGAFGLWWAYRRYPLRRQLASVRPRIWVLGAASLLVVLVPFLVYFLSMGEAGSYLMDVPMVGYPVRMAQGMIWSIRRLPEFVTKGYVGQSRAAVSWAEQGARIMRWYQTLATPVLLALAAMAVAATRWLLRRRRKAPLTLQDGLAWMLAIWWVLDMGLIWVSPRPYEQYYLPLNASAAMLGGYLVWRYAEHLKTSGAKGLWVGAGAAAAVLLIGLSWPIYGGLKRSPYSGQAYAERRNGYAQRLEEIAQRKRLGGEMAWVQAGEYIRQRTQPGEGLYVWGWYPGIYVQARRLAPVPRAFESDMHVKPPRALAAQIRGMVDAFRKEPPAYIVDSRKTHFPNDRPPLELWPQTQQGFLPDDPSAVRQYEQGYRRLLVQRIDEEEAQRFDAMKPLRDYVRENYGIAATFGIHVVFERKDGGGAAAATP